MKAIIVENAGPPDVLQIKEVPRPIPKPGWILIKIHAFGLNRSELFTRQGHSPSVKFPRILGIECVGEVEEDPEQVLQKGQKVAAIMGGMGRDFDGSYAEYTCIPRKNVIPFESTLDWCILGAIPETFLTAYWTLMDGLEVKKDQTILIRGGTSSVGMAAISLAKNMGLKVYATTRNSEKESILTKNGANKVIIDDGAIAKTVKLLNPNGVDRVLELVGTTTLLDSLQCTAPKGIVCNTGILGNWKMDEFEPLTAIPSTVRLTTYTSENITTSNSGKILQKIIEDIQNDRYNANLDKEFDFDEIVKAHQYMENNLAKGKLVVRV